MLRHPITNTARTHAKESTDLRRAQLLLQGVLVEAARLDAGKVLVRVDNCCCVLLLTSAVQLMALTMAGLVPTVGEEQRMLDLLCEQATSWKENDQHPPSTILSLVHRTIAGLALTLNERKTASEHAQRAIDTSLSSSRTSKSLLSSISIQAAATDDTAVFVQMLTLYRKHWETDDAHTALLSTAVRFLDGVRHHGVGAKADTSAFIAWFDQECKKQTKRLTEKQSKALTHYIGEMRGVLKAADDAARASSTGSNETTSSGGSKQSANSDVPVLASPAVWQPDKSTQFCPLCQVEFGMFTRRHHCRLCGKLCCDSCSPHRVSARNSEAKTVERGVRACSKCVRVGN